MTAGMTEDARGARTEARGELKDPDPPTCPPKGPPRDTSSSTSSRSSSLRRKRRAASSVSSASTSLMSCPHSTPTHTHTYRTHTPSQRVWTCLFTHTAAAVCGWYSWWLYAVVIEVESLVRGVLHSPGKVTTRRELTSMLVAYCGRLFGSVVLGHVGDHYDRKEALGWSMLLSGVSTLGMAFFPLEITHRNIRAGLRCLRFFQSTGLGGVWSGTVLGLYELSGVDDACPFYASFSQAGLLTGVALAFATGAGVRVLRVHMSVGTWPWNVAFAVAAVLSISIGAFMLWSSRTTTTHIHTGVQRKDALEAMEEEVEDEQHHHHHHHEPLQPPCCPLAQLSRRMGLFDLLIGLLIISAMAYLTEALYITYLPMIQNHTQLDTPTRALLSLSAVIGLMAVFTIISGAVTSWVDFRKVYLFACLLAVPSIWVWLGLLAGAPLEPWNVAVEYAVSICVALGLLMGPLPSVLAYVFTPCTRYTGTAIIFHGSNMIFRATQRALSSTNQLHNAQDTVIPILPDPQAHPHTHLRPPTEFDEKMLLRGLIGSGICIASALSSWYVLMRSYKTYGEGGQLRVSACVQTALVRRRTSLYEEEEEEEEDEHGQ